MAHFSSNSWVPLEAPLLLMPWKTDVVQLGLEQISYCLCFYVSQAPVLRRARWIPLVGQALTRLCTCVSPATSAFHQVCAFWNELSVLDMSAWSCKFFAFYYWWYSHTFRHRQLVLYLKISMSSLSPQKVIFLCFFWRLCSLNFIFRFRIHFEKIVCMLWYVSKCIFSPHGYSGCSTIIYCILTLYFLSMFIENQMTICVDMF